MVRGRLCGNACMRGRAGALHAQLAAALAPPRPRAPLQPGQYACAAAAGFAHALQPTTLCLQSTPTWATSRMREPPPSPTCRPSLQRCRWVGAAGDPLAARRLPAPAAHPPPACPRRSPTTCTPCKLPPVGAFTRAPPKPPTKHSCHPRTPLPPSLQNDPLLAQLSPASLLDLTRMMAYRLSTLAQVRWLAAAVPGGLHLCEDGGCWLAAAVPGGVHLCEGGRC